MEDELAALGRGHRGCHADRAAELIGCPNLSLADALHLGGVQGVDLASTLLLVLLAHLGGQAEKGDEDGFEFALAVDLAGDIADQATQPGAQKLELPPGPLELMGVGVATL
jgi:hypothetical protein